jgi:hypothetical protein
MFYKLLCTRMNLETVLSIPSVPNLYKEDHNQQLV